MHAMAIEWGREALSWEKVLTLLTVLGRLRMLCCGEYCTMNRCSPGITRRLKDSAFERIRCLLARHSH